MSGNFFKFHPIFAQILVIIVIMVIGIIIYSPFDKILNAIENQNYEKAINIANIGSKIYPSSKWYSFRGYAKFQTGDFQGAIQDYDKAYKLETDDYKIINFDNKIFIKYYMKDYKSALNDFDYEINNAKDEFIKDSFLWDKAQFLYNIEEYEKALDIYNDLLIKSDEDKIYLLKARLYFERAQVYKRLNKEDLAKKDLEQSRSSNVEETFENPIPVPTLLIDDEN